MGAFEKYLCIVGLILFKFRFLKTFSKHTENYSKDSNVV